MTYRSRRFENRRANVLGRAQGHVLYECHEDVEKNGWSYSNRIGSFHRIPEATFAEMYQ